MSILREGKGRIKETELDKNLTDKLNQELGKISQIETNVTSNTAKINVIEGNVSDNTSNINDLQNRLDTTNSDVDNVQNILVTYQADLESKEKDKGASLIGINDNNFTATNVEGALNELFINVSNGKSQIASAITDMGQTASGGDTFTALGTKIKAISTDANAGIGDVLSGKTFYQGGSKKSGTMPNRGAITITPSTKNQSILNGYHSGSGYVKGDANLVAGNIKKGVSIFGVAGSLLESGFAQGEYTIDRLSSNGSNTQNISGLAFSPKIIICFPSGIENWDWANSAAFWINGESMIGFEGGDIRDIKISILNVTSTGFQIELRNTASTIYKSMPIYWRCFG